MHSNTFQAFVSFAAAISHLPCHKQIEWIQPFWRSIFFLLSLIICARFIFVFIYVEQSNRNGEWVSELQLRFFSQSEHTDAIRWKPNCICSLAFSLFSGNCSTIADSINPFELKSVVTRRPSEYEKEENRRKIIEKGISKWVPHNVPVH